jgi:DNA polymerase III delta prime subunit
MLKTPTKEQLDIIDAIQKYNVKVNSVAGSGKTTTVLHMAQALQNESILLLTYNARLKIETRNRKDELKLNNLEVHSYHSFCCSYYDKLCYKDQGIINLLKKNKKSKKLYKFNIIVIDEAQDMSKLYYKLVNKIIADNQSESRLCVIGDKYQSIYLFKNADYRFITMADKIFKPNELEWKELKLTMSFRITNQMANFINHCVMGFNYISAQKNGNKVRYIMTDTFNFERPLMEVLMYLKDCHYDDIFIIAPSIKAGKNDSPIRVLANALTKRNIPIHVPIDDEEKLSEDIIKNKIVFSTFHQVKGLERKHVIVYGFDESYFQYFNKGADPNVCPNELYVAITRGIENLTIFHGINKNYVPFLKDELLEKYTYYERKHLNTAYDNGNSITMNVSEITKHLPSEIVNSADDFFSKKLINKKEKLINISVKTKQNSLVESVAEINGVVIPAYFEYINNNQMSIYNILISKGQQVDIKLSKDMPTSDLLKLATQYVSFSSGYNFKMKQIVNYNWMNNECFDEAVDRLELCIDKNSKFEVEVFNPDIKMGKIIVGRIDCIDKETIWEFKCTKELDTDHFIQLAIYALLNEKLKKLKKDVLNKKIKEMEKNILIINEIELVEYKNIILDDTLIINKEKYVVYKIDFDKIKVYNEKMDKKSIKNQNIMFKRLKKISDQNEINKLKEEVKTYENKNIYKLMNILTNEIYEINFELDKLEEMINFLMYHKFKSYMVKTDEEFINDIFNIEIENTIIEDNPSEIFID